MNPMISWLICILAACEFGLNTARLAEGLQAVASWRRRLLADPASAQRSLCSEPNQVIKLYQKQGDLWVLSCDQPQAAAHIARYWRIDTRIKYGMLFLVELPITVTIVILT